MEPDRIEEILNNSFPKDEPEGMKERVMSAASRELRPARFPVWKTVKYAFVCGMAAFVILANVQDNARQARISGEGSSINYNSPSVRMALLQRLNMAHCVYLFPGKEVETR